MAPKKKGQKMDLGSFLMDSTTGGSWADEMEDLPTGPSGEPGFGGAPGGLGGSHLSRGGDRYGDRGGGPGGDRGGFDRPMRQEIPIPNEPPFTAFAGNLSFETTEGDLEDFFAPLKTVSVRLVMGPDARPKGFGYVEFESQDDLKQALARTGADLTGRQVRIGVAEPPRSREGRADDEPTWERKGPLPPAERRGGGFGGGFSNAGADNRGPRRDYEEVERDGPIRGGRFTPSAEPPSRGGGPGAGGFGRSFSAGPPADAVEREGPIRGGKFVPSEPAAGSSNGGGGFGGFRRASEQSAAAGGSRADEAGWQRSGPLAPTNSSSGGAPAQRQKLQLAARSVSAGDSATTSSSSTSSKPSPFGAAKPINTAERERQIEEKLEKERAAAVKPSALATSSSSSSSATATTTTAADSVASSTAPNTTVVAGVNPFGGAKPINTTQRDREVEEKLAEQRLAAKPQQRRSSSSSNNTNNNKNATAALRKDGFSYAAAGSGARRPSAAEGAKPGTAGGADGEATATKKDANGSAASPASPKSPASQQKSLISALEETTI